MDSGKWRIEDNFNCPFSILHCVPDLNLFTFFVYRDEYQIGRGDPNNLAFISEPLGLDFDIDQEPMLTSFRMVCRR